MSLAGGDQPVTPPHGGSCPPSMSSVATTVCPRPWLQAFLDQPIQVLELLTALSELEVVAQLLAERPRSVAFE
jgi:hypothetical protein